MKWIHFSHRYFDILTQPNKQGVLFTSPINRRNSKERKDAYGRVLPVFLKTRFGQWLFGLRPEIERVFNE